MIARSHPESSGVNRDLKILGAKNPYLTQHQPHQHITEQLEARWRITHFLERPSSLIRIYENVHSKNHDCKIEI